MGTLTDTLFAATLPDRAALKLDDALFTCRELASMVARAAEALRDSAVGRGDRVGLQNPLLKAGEVAHQLSDSGAGVIIAWSQCALAAQAASDAASATCLVLDPATFEGLLSGAGPVIGSPSARTRTSR